MAGDPMTRLVSVGFSFLLLASCGTSQQAMEGYQRCMSDKRKAHSKELSAFIEACGNQKDMETCLLGKPQFAFDSERKDCKDEYGIK